MTKLNLGSGNILLDGYINIDLTCLPTEATTGYHYIEADVMQLSNIFRAESVDEVRASHFFEHLTHYEITTLLYKISLVLRPGGLLHIITPDYYRMMLYMKSKTVADDFNTVDIMHAKFFNSEEETLHRSIWYDDVGRWYIAREGFFKDVEVEYISEFEIGFKAIRV